VEIVWFETHIALSLERKRPHCTGQYKYTIYNHMCFKSHVFLSQDITIRQIDRVQRTLQKKEINMAVLIW